MLISIDASRANIRQKTGVEWYGAHVIRELAHLDQANDYRLYSWEPLRDELADLPPNFTNRVLPPQRLWSHTALSAELKANLPDHLFIPSHIVPRIHPPHTTVSVHDIGFRHFRKNYRPYHYASLQVGTRLSLRWASHVLVPSQFVATDVQRSYPGAAGKVTVVPNGVDLEGVKNIDTDSVETAMKKYRVRDPYIIFLGRLETRKNVVRLIEAFYRLKDSGLFGGQLVLAGNPGVGYEAIRTLITKRRTDDVVQTGYVAELDRIALLAGARLMAFPSLYEGFGIPILEAFSTGTPVLTSERGAMAEVAGKAALLVDPEDTSAIHHGLERVLSDEPYRQKLSAAGLKRVQQFTWRRTATEVHRILTS